MDPELIELATKVFDLARSGDAATLTAYLEAGVPANLTNDRGDTLLMLAAYHGHLEAVSALLDHGADPNRPNDKGQTPPRARFSRARTTSCAPCSPRAPIPTRAPRPPATRPPCSARPTSSTCSADITWNYAGATMARSSPGWVIRSRMRRAAWREVRVSPSSRFTPRMRSMRARRS